MIDYLGTQYNRQSSQTGRITGEPYYMIPEDAGPQEWPWYGDMDPFWAWFFLLGFLFMVAGLLYGIGLLIAMLIWM